MTQTKFEFMVAGSAYRVRAELAQVARESRASRSRLPATLCRDVTNKHDINAIEVRVGTVLIGYVPRDIAVTVAPQMNAGAQCVACVTEVRVTPDWNYDPIAFRVLVVVTT